MTWLYLVGEKKNTFVLWLKTPVLVSTDSAGDISRLVVKNIFQKSKIAATNTALNLSKVALKNNLSCQACKCQNTVLNSGHWVAGLLASYSNTIPFTYQYEIQEINM